MIAERLEVNSFKTAVGSMLVAEAAVGYALAISLAAAARGPEGILAIEAVSFYVAAFLAARLLRVVRLRRGLAACVVLACAGPAALAALEWTWYGSWTGAMWAALLGGELSQMTKAFPAAAVLSLLLAVLWCRGASLGLALNAERQCGAAFQLGMLILLSLHGLAALRAVPLDGGILVTVVFFSFGLLSIGSYRQACIARPGIRSGSHRLMLFAAIGVPVFVGLIVGLALDAEVITLLLLPIRLAGDAIAALLDFLARLFPQAPTDSVVDLTAMAMPAGAGEHAPLFQLPEEVRDVGRLIWGIVFIGLIALAAGRLLGDALRALFRQATTANAAVDAVSGGLINELRGLIGMLRRFYEDNQWRLHRWRRRASSGEPAATMSARETYRALLYWSAKRGVPRRPGETPDEYLVRLGAAFPIATAGLRLITASYVNARYSLREPTDDDLLLATQAWRLVHKVLRQA